MTPGVLPAVLVGLAVLVLGGLPSSGLQRLDRGSSARSGWTRRAPEAVGVLVGLLLGGPPVAVLVPLVVLGGRRLAARRLDAAARAAERTRAVAALLTLTVELRAGRAPEPALAAAAAVATGPFAGVLSAGRAASAVGLDVPDALLGCPGAGRTAVPEAVRGLAACWQVCSRSGSSLAPAVERLAVGLRDRLAQQQAVSAELAGPQATAAVLAVLPLGGVALAASLGADPLHVLLRTPVGLGCLVLGLTLDALGLWWTGRLVASAAAA